MSRGMMGAAMKRVAHIPHPLAAGAMALAAVALVGGFTLGGPVDRTLAGDEVLQTTFKGLSAKLAPSTYRKALKDTVTVKPAYGRKVKLYRYDAQEKEWVKVKTYTTANTKKAKLTIKYPKAWAQHAQTTWKLVAPQVAPATVTGDDGTETTRPLLEKKTAKVKVGYRLLDCKAGIVMDASTGRVLFDYNATKKRKIASMTKMVTAILLAENRLPSAKVKVSKAAAQTPWGCGLVAGDTVKAKDLMNAMMVQSANDAATAVATELSGSTGAFAKLMTKRAKELGCTSTVYKNAHGLDAAGAYSTALDQARIGSFIMTSGTTGAVRKAITKQSYSFKSKKKHKYKLKSSNHLLGTSYAPLGIKTGTTKQAGRCFAGAFDVGGRTYITVVMGALNESKRWENTRKLADFTAYAVKHGFADYLL